MLQFHAPHRPARARRWAFLAALAGGALPSIPGSARADCIERLFTAFDAMYKSGPFRTVMVTGSQSTQVRKTSEVALPQGVRITTEGPQPSSIVVLDDRVWIDQGGGYIAIPADEARKIATAVRASTTRAPTRPDKAECGGEETIEGRKFRVIAYQQGFKVAGQDGISTAKLYLDAASGLPARMTVTSAAMGVVSESEITIAYDKTLRIEAPAAVAPTKPAAGGGSEAPSKRP